MELSEYKVGYRVQSNGCTVGIDTVDYGTVVAIDANDDYIDVEFDIHGRKRIWYSHNIILVCSANDNEPSGNYVKIIKNGIAYYYSNSKMAAAALNSPITLPMMTYAEYVIDIKGNTFLKHKGDLMSIIDQYTGV